MTTTPVHSLVAHPPRPSGWIAGVDEAGRGPLAGPVAAAAVVLGRDNVPAGLADSKQLDAATRARLFDEILASAEAVSFALVPPLVISERNIRGATLEAMRRAVYGLSLLPAEVLVDGRDVPPDLPCPGRAIIGGDALEPCISAASIVAKVMRDRLMCRVGEDMPAYGFEIHKGYGTLRHRSAIREHGPTVHHRQGFAPFKNGTP
jgi:ribonuclease HII